MSSNPVRVRFDRFELDEANARLLRDGAPVAVAPTPFGVLCALARQPGSLLTTNALLDQVWGHQFVTDSVLRTAISELRTALDDDARQPRFIETVSRRGYRFIASTAAVVAASPVTTVAPSSVSAATDSFIGRTQALSRLGMQWNLACAGKRSIVWIAGEPGIGKTALIEHFISGLGDVLSVRGQCVDQYGRGEPYLPVLEALSELCRIDSTVVPLLRAVAPTWLLQLPWLSTTEERDVLRRELAGVTTDRMLREMGELLDRSAERRPLLLVTEDLHWSDRATIQLIDYVARRRGNARLMWLASFRLADLVALDHPLNALRRELRLHGLCEEIVLDPFSETEVDEYVKRHTSSPRDEAFVRALHERTDGMPLFVASIVREMSERAARDGSGVTSEQVAKIAVPENLAAIIEHYIAKLENEQRKVLSAAAVCGMQFRVGALAPMLEQNAESVTDICAGLSRAQLWLVARSDGEHSHEASTYAFRHALFRQVLYERMTPSARSLLHRKIAMALEQERTQGIVVAASELATHFERGGDATAAVRYYAQAAEGALGHFAPEECLRIVHDSLILLQRVPHGPERNTLQLTVETLHGLAAVRVLGAGTEAKAAFERAYALLDEVPQHPMRGRLLHGFGFMLFLRGEYAPALAIADRSEALGSPSNDPVLLSSACTVHGQVEQLQGRSRAACTWLERGLSLAEQLDVAPGEFLVDPQVMVLGLLANPLLHLGFAEQARSCLDRAYKRARDRKWPMAQLVAIWHNALFEVRLGNAERVGALADEMHALVDEYALAHGRAACRWFRGWADARMGSPRDGYEQIRTAYEENTRLGMLAGASEVLGYATEALLLAGDYTAAQKEVDEAFQIAEQFGERVYLPQLHLLQAAIARARGEPKDAEGAVRRAIAEAKAQEAPWLELITLIDLCEHERARAEDRRTLAALVERLPKTGSTTAVAKACALINPR